jgi:beta-lactamase superfamily II metal-dependent hydrolase
MNENLLVRAYNVGFGDCIYVQIPDQNRLFTMLIDCGTSAKFDEELVDVLKDIKKILPNEGSKKRLDLLVVTHPHADHIKGFDPKYFKDIKIKHIWLSCFMDKKHPLAEKSHSLQGLAEKAANSLISLGFDKKAGLYKFLRNTLCNDSALEALHKTLPKKNKIKTLYISRDLADPNKNLITKYKKRKHKLSYSRSTTYFADFNEADTCIRVLSPEWDIDGYYLGKEGVDFPVNFNSIMSLYDSNGKSKSKKFKASKRINVPANISKRDFRVLNSSLFYSGLSFVQSDDDLKNNTSVVLLVEWRGRRLLFAGDAEFKGKKVTKGRRNMNWDVMLEVLKNEDHLAKPLDFLKVGHHGSVNGTPFVDRKNKPQTILDTLLPQNKEAKVVVSTIAGKHGEDKEVPYIELMKELGNRCSNSCRYPEHPEIPQPQRTDLEGQPWIDIEITPVSN